MITRHTSKVYAKVAVASIVKSNASSQLDLIIK